MNKEEEEEEEEEEEKKKKKKEKKKKTTYLRQTMFLVYIMLQLFRGYSVCCI